VNEPLLRVRIRAEQDVFLVRQLGREVARAVGLESQDQTRLATALSEVGRLMLAADRDTDVAFIASTMQVPTLWVEMSLPVPGDAERLGPQLELVARLVDTMEVGDGGNGTVVRMSRRLPPSAPPLTPGRTSARDSPRTSRARRWTSWRCRTSSSSWRSMRCARSATTWPG
jgi:hypothetical protein